MTPFRINLIAIVILAAVALGCGGQLNTAKLTARELMDIGMEKYNQGKYRRSTEAFQAIVFNYPGETFVDTAQYYLGLSYFAEKSYILAQVEFNRLLLNYPGSPFAPQAQLMKAVCFFKGTPDHYGLDQTDLHTAVQQFEDFIVDYPESEALDEAKAYLKEARHRLARKLYENGIIYIRLNDFRAARVYFQKVIDDYTETEYAPRATFQLAVCHWEEKDWDKAHELFDNFRIVFADHPWAAEAAEKACEAAIKGGEEALEQGDSALARSRFERFLTVCDSDPEKTEEVRQILSQIGEAPVVEVDSSDAGS